MCLYVSTPVYLNNPFHYHFITNSISYYKESLMCEWTHVFLRCLLSPQIMTLMISISPKLLYISSSSTQRTSVSAIQSSHRKIILGVQVQRQNLLILCLLEPREKGRDFIAGKNFEGRLC